jgi:hypothetical protein
MGLCRRCSFGQCMRADGRADGGFPASDQAVGVVVVHNNPVGAAALGV